MKKTRRSTADGEDNTSTIHALDTEDMHTLLAAFRDCCSPNISFALVALAFSTGARRGELLALRWSDIDLDGATLRVTRAVERMKGVLTFKEPKTDSSKRTISLDDGTV